MTAPRLNPTATVASASGNSRLACAAARETSAVKVAEYARELVSRRPPQPR